MNIGIEDDQQPHWGVVLRAADRMRLEGCVNALTREGLCLALHCPHEALLDHYVRMLLTRLRAEPAQHQVEVYFPANTDSLLDRFNAVLSGQSLSSATRPANDTSQVRVWVVHDAQKVSASELQLMAKLIQNFPGAQVRALLLFHGHQVDAERLEPFGRKVLRWDIELPSPEQAQTALDIAQEEGRQAQMGQLLRRLGALPVPTPTIPLSLGMEAQEIRHEARVSPPSPAARMAFPRWKLDPRLLPWIARMKEALTALRSHRVVVSPSGQTATQKLKWGLGVATLLTVLIVLWMQPKAFVAPQKETPALSKDAPPAQVEPTADKAPASPQQKQGPLGFVRALHASRS